MNYFFGFDSNLTNKVDWFFNLNHLFLILFVASFVVICCFLFRAKSEKGKKITKLCLAAVLFVLEIGRVIYKYCEHVHNGGNAGNFNWWWNFSFQMCAIMCWTTIVTLILSSFLKKENRFLQYLYNIVFGCGMLGGFLTFMYPDCITETRPFLHFVNIQTIAVHALLIFVPIYFILKQDFKPQIQNIWKVFVGYVFIGSVAMSASLISGNNFAYSLKFDLFDLGLPFPWHLPVVMLVMVLLATVVYGAFEIVRLIVRKVKKVEVSKPEKQERNHMNTAIVVVSRVCAIAFGASIMLGIASLLGTTHKTWLGLFCLLGLAYMILLLVFAENFKQYMTNKLDTENKRKHITFVVLTFIFALPVGILYLVEYLRGSRDI